MYKIKVENKEELASNNEVPVRKNNFKSCASINNNLKNNPYF